MTGTQDEKDLETRRRLLRTFVRKLIMERVESLFGSLHETPSFQELVRRAYPAGGSPEKGDILGDIDSVVDEVLKEYYD